jgi:hypothetical protein
MFMTLVKSCVSNSNSGGLLDVLLVLLVLHSSSCSLGSLALHYHLTVRSSKLLILEVWYLRVNAW